MRWEEGRQGTGYLKKKLLESHSWFLFDLYLLKFPEGAYVPPHKDEVGYGLRHYRVNLILWPAKRGGEFKIDYTNWITVIRPFVNWPFLKIFRPDRLTHSVTLVEEGTRYVLSLGFVLR